MSNIKAVSHWAAHVGVNNSIFEGIPQNILKRGRIVQLPLMSQRGSVLLLEFWTFNQISPRMMKKFMSRMFLEPISILRGNQSPIPAV